MALQDFQQTLSVFFNSIHNKASGVISTEAEKRKKKELESFGARGIATSGSGERALLSGIDENASNSLAQYLMGVSNNEANIRAQSQLGIDTAIWNRQNAVEDFFRDTVGGAFNTVLAGPAAGLSAGLGANVAGAIGGKEATKYLLNSTTRN